jgi:hypothetical protein
VVPMRAVTHQCMNLCISNLIIETGAIGTGKLLRQNAFGSAAPAFSFAPGCQGMRAEGWAMAVAPSWR